MLIRTSAPNRQIERMLAKRDWRRHLASRVPEVALVTQPADNVVSVVAAFELGLVKKLHRPARAEKAAAIAPALPRNFQLQSLRRHLEEETTASR
jgi:hypothetical protein